MRLREYFPLGIATGLAFCNRHSETDLLIENMQNGKHTLLIATRRYGKSSLALHALEKSKLPYIEMDFYMATNEKIIEQYLLNAIVDLMGVALGAVDKLIYSIKRYVKILKPKLNIEAAGLKLELKSDAESDPATNIKEALFMLEQLLAEKEQHAVLLLDEFQNVGVIAQGKGIEGAIRHVAQKTKYLTFLFSGSNRKLLKTMFEDETRPLYKLCWHLSLPRIQEEHYVTHLQKIAKLAWKKTFSQGQLNQIFLMTERHPYYLNKLCDRLFRESQLAASVEFINQTWEIILLEEKSDAVKDISMLSLGQKNVLYHIAKNPHLLLTSKESVLKLEMTSSSILAAAEALEEKDFLEKENGHYRLISPVIKFYVLKNSKQE